MARTKGAEDGLLRACQERDELESELSRMPLGGGRTLRQRQRKEYLEERLDGLRSQISSYRMQIKKWGAGNLAEGVQSLWRSKGAVGRVGLGRICRAEVRWRETA
jgi:hypothetical protein